MILIKVEIFQLPAGDRRRFWGSDCEYSKPFVREDYTKVYECERPADYDEDEAFIEFNRNRPEDYHISSLSVGDIVAIGGEEYFCESFGWSKVSDVEAGIMPHDSVILKY